MAIQLKIEAGADLSKYGFSENAGWTTLAVGGVDKPHVQARDFSTKDDWSIGMRSVITDLGESGVLRGKWTTEYGAGDLRNVRVARPFGITGFIAIEKDPERTDMAKVNLGLDPRLASLPHELITADVVDFLHRWPKERPGQKIKGWVFMCLPQSPQGDNSADAYDSKSELLVPYSANNEKVGLVLIAGTLDKTNAVADEEVRLLTVNSHRVVENERLRVIRETGWLVEKEYVSEPIKQDVDTPVGWMDHPDIDDGQRFFERTRSGLLVAISAAEAETRRAEAKRIEDQFPGRGREKLNVWHRLSFYQLIPNRRLYVNGIYHNDRNGLKAA